MPLPDLRAPIRQLLAGHAPGSFLRRDERGDALFVTNAPLRTDERSLAALTRALGGLGWEYEQAGSLLRLTPDIMLSTKLQVCFCSLLAGSKDEPVLQTLAGDVLRLKNVNEDIERRLLVRALAFWDAAVTNIAERQAITEFTDALRDALARALRQRSASSTLPACGYLLLHALDLRPLAEASAPIDNFWGIDDERM